MNYMVVTLFNPTNNYNIFVYQKSRSEFKVKSQIGHNSYSIDYVWGVPDLARSVFCFLINGFSLVTNNLGFEFGHAVHAGDFSELDKPQEELPVLPEYERPLIQKRCSKFRTAYEEPTAEDLLIRTQNVIIEPEKEFPWKLAD